ncbi:phosphoglucosamine mutase [Labilibacter sediminis]|nr:phosphoglucosamine mutase [Labilibacter sediminis]
MTLIKSISGIRGTIGGDTGEALTPIDIVEIVSAYATWLKQSGQSTKVVIGRDARPSGHMVNSLVVGALVGSGIDIIDLDLATTPTVEMAVVTQKAGGGIIITASHNPVNWNALKLLNHKGEFISANEGSEILKFVTDSNYSFSEVEKIGSYELNKTALTDHINSILNLPLVDVAAIQNANFSVIVDPVNSVGGFSISQLLNALGVNKVKVINGEPNGNFAHNPEPLPENITEIVDEIKNGSFDLGIIVDPDVDRLALVSENGEPFGEEYTLVSVADYVLSNTKGALSANLSSTMSLKEIAKKHYQEYFEAAVGEVNVVQKMKDCNAVIGGEGNGGIIYPELHYGRDALVGIALFLTNLAKLGVSASTLRKNYPNYPMIKDKINLEGVDNVDEVLVKIQEAFKQYECNTIDGLKINFEKGWVHMRKSNTEPIIRIYAEAITQDEANALIQKVKDLI